MPTVNQGMRKTFFDTVGIPRDVTPIVDMLSPSDVPLLHLLGPCRKSVTGTKHEWLEDELVPQEGAVATAIASDATTSLVVKAGQAEYFLPDDIIRINNEYLLVTAVDTATDTLTVVRGYASSSPANCAVDDVVERISVAKPEGAEAGKSRHTAKVADYNFTQIFDEIVEVSGTRQAISQYGIADDYAYELMKVVKDRAIMLEKACLFGLRHEDTTAMRRTMGGLFEFLTANNVDAQAAALTKADLDDLIADVWRGGGEPRTMVMNIDQKDRIYGLGENIIRRTESDTSYGGAVETYTNNLGTFRIVLDRWMPRDRILLLDLEKVGLSPLQGRGWTHTLMGNKGDFVHGQVLTEQTLEVRQIKAHGVIKNLAL
ncbi:MAG: DUF5309 family protein [Anaerosomatales bacterium]|nr:DUF5309 family protein [Anaerosomatales bacterium]